MRYSCKECHYTFDEIPLVHNHPSVMGRYGIACPACRKIQTVEKTCPRCHSSALRPVAISSISQKLI